jgi:hypothetical protein
LGSKNQRQPNKKQYAVPIKEREKRRDEKRRKKGKKHNYHMFKQFYFYVYTQRIVC